jgi:hypothetical protein
MCPIPDPKLVIPKYTSTQEFDEDIAKMNSDLSAQHVPITSKQRRELIAEALQNRNAMLDNGRLT